MNQRPPQQADGNNSTQLEEQRKTAMIVETLKRPSEKRSVVKAYFLRESLSRFENHTAMLSISGLSCCSTFMARTNLALE